MSCEFLLTIAIKIMVRRNMRQRDVDGWVRRSCGDNGSPDQLLEQGAIAMCYVVFATQMLASTHFLKTFQVCWTVQEGWHIDDGADDTFYGKPVKCPAWRRVLLTLFSPCCEAAIWLLLFCYGTLYLFYSPSLGEMILNAVALCFIIDVDELAFAAYTKPRHRAGLEKRRAFVHFGTQAGENTVGRDAPNAASAFFFDHWFVVSAVLTLLYSVGCTARLCR